MKLHLLILLSLSTLLYQSSASTPEAVLDTAGQKLRPGIEYNILPVIRGPGGGLTLVTRNVTCPFYVGQENHDIDKGLPLTFSPVDPNEGVVRLSTDLNVQFNAVTICIQSLVWRIENDESTGQLYVVTDGVKGNPGKDTLGNWFKINKYRVDTEYNWYKLVFCPTVCDFCRPRCGDLGIFHEGGERYLGVSGSEFPVVFKRV